MLRRINLIKVHNRQHESQTVVCGHDFTERPVSTIVLSSRHIQFTGAGEEWREGERERER